MKLPGAVVLFGGSPLVILLLSGDASAFQVGSKHNGLVVTSSPSSSSSRKASWSSLAASNPFTLDVSPPAARDVAAMDEWATNCGVQRADGFELTCEDGVNFGAAASAEMAAGSSVLFVPAEMILTSSGAEMELGEVGEEAVEQLVRLDAAKHLPRFWLFLKVLAEYEKGVNSPWFPWLNSLPREFYNGASMTHACYECLPPLVSRLAMAERVTFTYFQSALKSVSAFDESVRNNADLARWAYNIVQTRSFGEQEGGEKRIVPMADMFNHGTETEINFNYDEGGNCVAYTTRDVPAGSPLRCSYGDPTNPSALFATYGFLDESSPATFCKIMYRPTQQLKDIGLDYSRMLFYKDTGDVSEEVWDVLLYQSLAKEGDDVQRGFYEAHMNGDAETKAAYHQRYFLETAGELKNHVDTFLDQLDKLSAKAYMKDPVSHPRIPIILQHNEFVRQTFQTVKAQIDPMVADARAQAGM